ncbi:M48 family metallopeptidase [Aliidiomarina halalkaliphila]|uniref:Putative beta-barrel assembly-enhancing protease n=1 Tax=Aliidiomarina halalkaliphila TaxID=2593535 RepID=A0A552X4N0_9GAMM|nr:M48 family metalloprotease [Aliidiomarina halalkaliphila]TRW49965.1 M48 family metallopeptidase [Aliidiomarina halalkaliphila]
MQISFRAPALVMICTAFLIFFITSSHQASAHSRTDVPTIGTAGGAFMSIERERLLGEHFAREVRGAAPVIEDPVLREYLEGVGNRLVRHTDNVRYPFSFFWIRDDSINAFAFLGGQIGMHTGLLMEAQDESELASVLSHEIAHVTQRHIARNMERITAAAPMTVAQIIGGMIIGVINPTLGMAVLTANMAGFQQRQINYTRQFELEADRIGMQALHRAGYDPEGAPRFFGRLQDRYRYTSTLPQFLVTHPLPDSRVADTQSRARALGPRSLPPSLDFHLAKARVRVRFSNRPARDVLTNVEQELRQERDTTKREGLLYAQALALYELERYEQADQIILDLRETHPLNLFFIDTQTDIWLAQKRYEEVLEMLTTEYSRRPNNQVVTLNFVYAANHAGKYDIARRVVQDYLIENRRDVLAWQLLHESHQKSGNVVGQHEAMAEVMVLRANFTNAIEELHSAFAKSNEHDLMNRQRIQARIQQIQNLQVERERVFDF